MTQPTSNAPSMRSRPIEEIRLGMIKAAIWKNDTETGPRFNVTFERVFRDGEEWKSTTSFGRDDLLLLSKVADQAHSWIMAVGRSHPSGNPEAAPEQGLAESTLPRRRR
jgi:hypothetical protein